MGAKSPTPGTTLAPGTQLGRYELVQSVAVGGMAEIYLARTQGPQRFEKYVILKRILPYLAGDESFVEMFLEEARLAASMSHSNIVQVHDFGEVDGSYFFTMEYVHGEDARAILKAYRKRRSRIPLADAITIVSNVAAGLHYAHELEDSDGQPLGVVHRDVTPSNILVTFDGTVKIADFGIAKATQRSTSTRSGTVKGKVSYMSPEQCDGAMLDRRSDIFALAIVLYELTTGHKMFDGDNDLAIMRRIIERDAPSPLAILPDYPRELAAILARALARDPTKRYATVLEMQTALEKFCASKGLITSAPSLGATMVELFGKRPHPWRGQRVPTVITLNVEDSEWDAESAPTTMAKSATSLSAVASEVALIPPAPAPKRGRWVLAGIATLAIGGGAVAYVTQAGSSDAGATLAPATTPTPPPPPVEPPAIPPPPPPEPEVAKPEVAKPEVAEAAKPEELPVLKPPPRAPKPVAAKPPAKPVNKPAPVKPAPAKPAEPEPKRDINSPFLPK